MFKYIIEDEITYGLYTGQIMISTFKGKVIFEFKDTNELQISLSLF